MPLDDIPPAVPPPDGGVAGPFCATANEVAPATRTIASAIVLRLDIIFPPRKSYYHPSTQPFLGARVPSRRFQLRCFVGGFKAHDDPRALPYFKIVVPPHNFRGSESATVRGNTRLAYDPTTLASRLDSAFIVPSEKLKCACTNAGGKWLSHWANEIDE